MNSYPAPWPSFSRENYLIFLICLILFPACLHAQKENAQDIRQIIENNTETNPEAVGEWGSLSGETAGLEWSFRKQTNYEAFSPGGGKAVTYSTESAWIDVFKYSEGISDWKEDLADKRLKENFEGTLDAIKEMEARGNYQDVSIVEQGTRKSAGVDFYYAQIRYELEGKKIESHTFMRVQDGELLKYRLSFRGVPEEETRAAVLEFVDKVTEVVTKPNDD